MSLPMLHVFLWGAEAMASLTAALLFLRFWRLTRDRLFAFFSLAFCALALNWIVLAVQNAPAEGHQYVYLLRLAAFVLIIVGIVDKNRSGRR